jgi:hypothetical protein
MIERDMPWIGLVLAFLREQLREHLLARSVAAVMGRMIGA